MTDKEIMKNNPLETEQQSAQEIENIKQWVREKKGEDYDFSIDFADGKESIFKLIEEHGFEKTKKTFFEWEKEFEEWAKQPNVSLFLEYLREREASNNQAQELQLTKRINTLLEMVPSNESLSGEEQVKNFFLEREKRKEYCERRRKEEKEKYEEFILEFSHVFWNDEFAVRMNANRKFEKWMGEERIKERVKWEKELRRNTNFYGGKVEDNPNFIGIRDRLFNGGLGELFAGFFNEEKIENKEAQELEKVKELALTKGSNQGEVKKFISKTGKELVKIKEEIEQREKNWEIEKNDLMDKNESLEVKNKEGERKFSEKIEELTKEREILQIKLQKKEEERKKVTNQIQAWKQEQEELRKKALQNAKLNSPREIHLEQLVNQQRAKAQEWAEKQKQAEIENKNLEERNIELEIRISELDQSLASMTATAEQLEKAQEQLSGEYDELLKSWELKGNLLIATEALKEDLEIDLESAKESIEQLNEFRQKDKERYETENQNWQNAANKWEKDRNKWKEEDNEKHKKYLTLLDEKQEEHNKVIDLETLTENQEAKIKQLEEEKGNLEQSKNQLTREKNQLQAEKEQAEAAQRRAERVKRWALFGSAVQGVTTELLGEKWGKRTNTAIQFTSGAKLLSEMGDWTYDVWLMGIGVILLAIVPRLYRMSGKILEKQMGLKLPFLGDNKNRTEQTKKEQGINVVVNLAQPATNEPVKENTIGETKAKENNQPEPK